MMSMAIDATLHARAEFMDEFKDGNHAEWDPNYEINFWKERESELAETGEHGEAASEPSTPKLRVPKCLKLFRLRLCLRWLLRIRAQLKNPVENMRGLRKSRLLCFFFVHVIELCHLYLF